jgi:tetratricopeptide (TPR) repeat protein
MFRHIAKLCRAFLSSLGGLVEQPHALLSEERRLVLEVGDLIVQKSEHGWAAMKILAIDPWPEGTAAAHCMTYESLSRKPTVKSLKRTPVFIWHAPIDSANFDTGWERVGNQLPSEDELAGFVTYLKLTDFPRYLSFTGQNPEAIVRKANEHYQRALELDGQNKPLEGIAEYSQAIELFPLFYEAIDNRAFTYMELGKYREALCGFDESLRVNPDGVTAFFSKGECLMKLGDLKAARAIFKEGKTRFPEKHDLFSDFHKLAQKMT